MIPKNKGKTQPHKPQPFIRQLGLYAGGFWTTPVGIARNTDLTPLEKDILSVLIGLHMSKTQYDIGDGVQPGQKYLAEQTGSARPSVSNALRRLETKGYIAIEQRGLNQTNVYRLLML